MSAAPHEFARQVIAWQRRHGRHDLPWQRTRDPYRIWLAEIMLQQTQVTSVIPYYQRFLDRFPDLASLAAAPLDAVLALWAGLGYYSRARNLHRCAQVVVGDHGGEFPANPATLAGLPGIGRSTAAAVAAFAFGYRSAILDGNVKRVLCRYFAIEGLAGKPAVDRELWALADLLLPAPDSDTARSLGQRMRSYTQGLMDLGATVCKARQADCERCPLATGCVARREQRQHELPTRKPKRAIPERESTILLLDDGSGFLLEQRPAPGIWGGLLAPPELLADETSESVNMAVFRLGLRLRDYRRLPAVRHAFTHFRLTLRPLLIRVDDLPRAAEAAGLRQVAYGDLATAALPAPIRRLLSGLVSPS